MQRIGADRRKRIIIESLFILLLGLIILIDQLTKHYFATNFEYKEVKPVIEGFFYFTYHRNPGAAWSFLAGVSWAQTFFKIMTVIALCAFMGFYIYSIKNKYNWLKVGLIFAIGGTIGNFIDRLVMGEVIDFLGFIFGNYYFPIFNIADSFLVVGTIMMLIHLLFLDKEAIFKKNDAKQDV